MEANNTTRNPQPDPASLRTFAATAIGAANSPAGPPPDSLGRPLDAAALEIAARETITTTPFPAGEIRVERDRVIAGHTHYALTPEGSRRLCKRVGAPADYFETLPPELRARLLQHHL